MMQELSRKKMSSEVAPRVQPAGWAAEDEAHFSAAGVPEGDGIDLHNYWRAIKKRQWQILVFFCLVVGTVACGAMVRVHSLHVTPESVPLQAASSQ